MQIFLRNRKHTSGAASGVVDSLHNIISGQYIVIIIKEDVDHELYDFPGSIVLPGILVMCFRETTNNLLEDITHLKIGDDVRVKISFW